MTIRAVLDTNVLLSGLFWHGKPHALLDRVREGTLVFISSPALLAELAEVIARPKYDAILVPSNTSRERSLAELRETDGSDCSAASSTTRLPRSR